MYKRYNNIIILINLAPNKPDTLYLEMCFADIFVSRLDPQLIACDLQSYIVGNLHIEVDVELVKVTEYLSYFHVYSQCSQPNVFMSADLWPEGAYVR